MAYFKLLHWLTFFFFTGTPATASQMAKDVVTFLNWAAEPEHDERKKIGLKAVILFSALTAVSLYVKRFKWTVIKNRKICRWYLATHLVLLLIACFSLQSSKSLEPTFPFRTYP